MTPSPPSPSMLAPSLPAKAREAGTALVPARLMTQRPREAPTVAEKPAASTCLPPNPQLLDRIRGEYLEMPGLKLTLPQAQRLWHQRERECEGLLGALIDAKFLCRQSDGRYARMSELEGHQQTSARAEDSTGPRVHRTTREAARHISQHQFGGCDEGRVLGSRLTCCGRCGAHARVRRSVRRPTGIADRCFAGGVRAGVRRIIGGEGPGHRGRPRRKLPEPLVHGRQ